MSDTLRIIHMCDHIIKESSQNHVVGSVMIRGAVTNQISDFEISSIERVYQGQYLYREGMDYIRFEKNKVKWITGDPIPGSSIIMDFTENINRHVTYEPEDCPRCMGQGWFVDVASDGEVSVVSGGEKMVQDFVKILFTDSGRFDLGTRFHSIISGALTTEDVEMNIMRAIDEATTILQKQQNEMDSRGVALDEDERLASVIIEEVEKINEDAYYARILLISKSGDEYLFGFKSQ